MHGFVTHFNSYDLFNFSEFEELEAVPTMAVMDGPLEPSSASASVVSDVPDDPAFVNFFSVSTAVVHVYESYPRFFPSPRIDKLLFGFS